MSEETKLRIIEAGADLVHQKGFNNTGLKDILRAADVPKGSFYFYFDNKEAFGIEMVDHYLKQFKGMISPVLSDQSMPPLKKMLAVFESFRAYFKSQGYTRGCPVGNLSQEMSDLSEPFRDKLQQAMDGMINLHASLLKQARDNGDIPANLNIRETAIFIVEAWQGALTRMKLTKSDEPLEICHKFIFEKVLK